MLAFTCYFLKFESENYDWKYTNYKEFSVNNVDNSIIDINILENKINTKNIKISFQMKENIGVKYGMFQKPTKKLMQIQIIENR